MDKQKIVAAALTVVMGAIVAFSVRAENDNIADIGSSKSDVQNSIEAQESIKKELDQKLNELEKYKDDLVKYMEELNKTYDGVQQEIISLDSQISEKQGQIDEINLALSNAKIDIDEQYEAMKLRIQYLYESGDLNYLDAILSSGNITEMLNRVEYISNIMEYDRDMLDKYRESLAAIDVIKEELEKEMVVLESLKTEQVLKANELIELMNRASVNIQDKAEEISEAESIALEKEKEIESLNSYMEYLEEMESSIIAESIRESISESIRQSEEDSSRLESGEEIETTTKIVNDYVEQEGDLEKLAALIFCEAGGQSYEGKLAVGTVVMNRIANKIFPNTLEGVLTQPYQFSPVSVSGRYYLVLANKTYNKASVQAAQEILSGVRTGNWHFFRTVKLAITTGKIEAHPEGVIIGDHFFY